MVLVGPNPRSAPTSLPVIAGIIAPIVYAATVIAGAMLLPGYDHIRDSISSLTQSGRTGILGIQTGFLAYNVLAGAFAVGSLRHLHDWPWRIVFGLLLLIAMCGLLMWPFPQDPIDTPLTTAGLLHLVLAGIESAATILVLAICTWRLWAEGRPWLGAVAAFCLFVTAISGAMTALAVQSQSPIMGLYERFTIGSFEVWAFILALIQWRRPALLAGPERGD